MSIFGVLRRYVENGAGVSKWVGRDDRNYKSIFGGLTAGSSVRENFSVKLYRVKECTSEHLDSIFRCTVPHNGSAEPIKSEIGRVVQ